LRSENKILLAGAAIGLVAVGLVKAGNPPNMGYCIACFLRDLTGSLGLHRAAPVQYLRPEIVGLVLGAFVTSLVTREFRSVGGAAPLARFLIGLLSMWGMLVFLGCPLRTLLRLAGGDLNALAGLAGLVAGVGLGTLYLRQGFSLGRSVPQDRPSGLVFPGLFVVLLPMALLQPAFLFASKQGPGSLHAPTWLSLAAGLLLGALAQRTRLCLAGGLRDFILFRDTYLLRGFGAIFLAALAANLVLGLFKPGFVNQPVAHTQTVWNFLGMALAGLGFVLMGGCPLRQLVAAAEGNSDAAAAVLGMVFGAALAHNFGLAAGPAGVPPAGGVAVVAGLVVLAGYAAANVAAARAERLRRQAHGAPGGSG